MSARTVQAESIAPQEATMIGMDTATIERHGAGRRQVSFTSNKALGNEKLCVPRRLSLFQDHEPDFFASFRAPEGSSKQAKADDFLGLETEACDIGGEAKPWIVAHGGTTLKPERRRRLATHIMLQRSIQRNGRLCFWPRADAEVRLAER
jgi:hypothetical protein